MSLHVVAFPLLLSITSLNASSGWICLVQLFYVHRSLAYKYPPGELLHTDKVLV
jgi:hypothetical protein